MNEIQSSIGEIIDAVKNRDPDDDDCSTHEAGAFVSSIDLVSRAIGIVSWVIGLIIWVHYP